MVGHNVYMGIHGYEERANKLYDYLSGCRDKLCEVIKLADELGFIDERVISHHLGVGFIEAVEYKAMLKYIKYIHSDGGFCVPAVINNWYKETQGYSYKTKNMLSLEKMEETRSKYSSEHDSYRLDNIRSHRYIKWE